MKKNRLMTFTLALIMSFGFSLTAFANSSWVWITARRPYDLLPFVIVLTLVSETFFIAFFAKIESKSRVFVPVLAGNLLSYAMPYIFYSHSLYGEYYGLMHALDHSPYYTVGIHFLVMIIVAELPVVYLSLRKKAEDKKVLAISIVIINVLTTVFVALLERVLCRGQW